MYVFLAVAGSVLWLARTGGWMLGGYGPAGRVMLVVVAAGATVLWPMTRLSQASPGRGAIDAMFADVMVVLLPVQMVVWPMMWLAGWPASIVAAVAGVFLAWVAIIGGTLALALGGRGVGTPGDPRLFERGVWMAGILVVTLVAPAALGMYRGGQHPSWVAMLSPFTALLAITGVGLSGPQRGLTAEQWLALGSCGVGALSIWVAAAARAVLSQGGDRA